MLQPKSPKIKTDKIHSTQMRMNLMKISSMMVVNF